MEHLIEKVKPYFLESNRAHGFDHCFRAYKLGKFIALKEGADIEITETACILHDIGKYRKEGVCHAELGSQMSLEILKNIGFPQDKIFKVCYCIKVHRYSKGIIPITLEAKIVQDADRLEEIGALAIGRGLIEDILHNKPLYDPAIPPNQEYKTGGNKTSINFLIEKSLKLKPETFHTRTARELARERYIFTEFFVKQFLKEWHFNE